MTNKRPFCQSIKLFFAGVEISVRSKWYVTALKAEGRSVFKIIEIMFYYWQISVGTQSFKRSAFSAVCPHSLISLFLIFSLRWSFNGRPAVAHRWFLCQDIWYLYVVHGEQEMNAKVAKYARLVICKSCHLLSVIITLTFT